MNYDKWLELKENVKKNFTLVEEGESVPENIPKALDQFMVFDTPLGRIKAMRIVRPRVLDKKTNFSRRAGSETGVEYVYDENEITERLEVLKWNVQYGEWEKFDGQIG